MFQHEMIEQLLVNPERDSRAKQIATHVAKYESHPFEVADIVECLFPLRTPNKSWKMSKLVKFKYDLPVPEGVLGDRGNRWTMVVFFGYNAKKRVFKVDFENFSCSEYHEVMTYNHSVKSITVKRHDTGVEDLVSRRFVYYLQRLVGGYMIKIRDASVCTNLVDDWTFTYKVLCGKNVHVPGAMCSSCRGVCLKRKFALL